MSTLKAVNIQHPSSASVNAGTDASGNFLINSGYGSAATAYGCRAWVTFNGTGTVAIRASGNVSSITDSGVGLYVVNLTTAMPDTNYSLAGMASDYASDRGIVIGERGGTTRTASSFTVRTSVPGASTVTGVSYDVATVCVSVFR